MQTTLLLIRHGQTPWNALGKIQGCTDIELENEGRLQAQLLAEKLSGNFSAVYTSPLKRAHETASILANSASLYPVDVPACVKSTLVFGKDLPLRKFRKSILRLIPVLNLMKYRHPYVVATVVSLTVANVPKHVF